MILEPLLSLLDDILIVPANLRYFSLSGIESLQDTDGRQEAVRYDLK